MASQQTTHQTAEQVALRSRELFDQHGYKCAESALLAIAERLKIESPVIPGIATGFCSGMARTCGECGAVTGALMGLGLAGGRHSGAEPVDALYAQAQTLIAQFTAMYGSTNCQTLTGIDLGAPDGSAQFQAKGQMSACLDYVETATRIAVTLIAGCEPD